ncbi:DUF975 family protein [Clostridium oceanicum]|uniref:DUF975 family protein n=1 Tax=Clostridium oceanicum TaxID=1543 RepID=A0ABN1JD34_9CLOT
MWTRASVKEKAKKVLQVNYWKAFIVSLVILITGGNNSSSILKVSNNIIDDYSKSVYGAIDFAPLFFVKIMFLISLIVLITAILRLVLGLAIEIGGRKFFIRAAEGENNTEYLAYCFKEGRYFKVLITMVLRRIYIVLWTLLLIVPGIIKSYAYRMVPYILADNPHIGCNRAIKLSSKMTKGEKFNIFVFDLSFLGWYILGLLALGIGTIFVNPYREAAEAELYLVLRKRAIEKATVSCSELNVDEYMNSIA